MEATSSLLGYSSFPLSPPTSYKHPIRPFSCEYLNAVKVCKDHDAADHPVAAARPPVQAVLSCGFFCPRRQSIAFHVSPTEPNLYQLTTTHYRPPFSLDDSEQSLELLDQRIILIGSQ